MPTDDLELALQEMEERCETYRDFDAVYLRMHAIPDLRCLLAGFRVAVEGLKCQRPTIYDAISCYDQPVKTVPCEHCRVLSLARSKICGGGE